MSCIALLVPCHVEIAECTTHHRRALERSGPFEAATQGEDLEVTTHQEEKESDVHQRGVEQP